VSRSETFGLASAPAPEPAPVPAAPAPESAPVLFLELVFFPVQVRFLTGGGGGLPSGIGEELFVFPFGVVVKVWITER